VAFGLLAAGPAQATDAAAPQLARVSLRVGADAVDAAFSFDAPVRELTFARNPRGGARDDWRVADARFVLVHERGADRLRRLDGGTFSTAALTAPLRFEPFEDDYSAFSRFGDGGLLVHSGRFHACSEACPAGHDVARSFAIEAPGDATILLAGRPLRARADWTDRGDGTFVYIGPPRAGESQAFAAVVDATLPADLRARLDATLPALLAYYRDRIGVPSPWPRPRLFVSFDATPRADGRFGSKGGVLDGIVAMHVYGAGWRDAAASDALREPLAWFFAHEAAHLFQGRPRARDPSTWWIHEGGAEAFAYLAMRELDPAAFASTERRVAQAAADCARGLEAGPLADAHARGATSLHYTCGLVMQVALSRALHASARRAPGPDLFGLWARFLVLVDNGAPWTSATFLDTVRDAGLGELAGRLQRLLTTRIEAPQAFVAALLAARPSPAPKP
jgi:hypothetical protein